ncbi:MAG: hypothetical protein ACRYFS_22780 [Janthinobacterium lividum]
MDSKDFAEIIASEIQMALSPDGFQRHGLTFIAEHQEVIFLVSLEKQSNTRKDRLVVSLYVSVISKALSKHSREKAGLPPVKLTDLRWYSSHWRRNIANALGDDQGMALWRVESERQALEASKEIVMLLQEWGMPHFESLSSTAKIAAFLRGGGGENITDPPRQGSLEILDDLLLERLVG